jgi:endonuclease/exonuclease/phosphatase family metal-dependent hydrolase
MGEIARAGRYQAIPGPTLSHERGSYGNVLLSRLPVESVGRINLSLPGREPRGAIDARVRTRDGGTLRCVCTHLGLSGRERRHQLACLLQGLAEAWHEPLVLLGDFNEWLPWSPVERALSRLFGSSPRPRSFPAPLPLLALDRLWIHPPGLLLDLRAVRNPLTRAASDHLPLVARIRCPGPGRL